jgi:RNA polymerase sigma-70 factor (ECF subfamily)
MLADHQSPDPSSLQDDRLRLIFTCCHPALVTDAQVALTLRLLGGLTAGEIAQGFLVTEATMARRLTRAKQKIKANRIPYRVPADAELPSRLPGVLGTLYLVFNEGYLPSSQESAIWVDLCAEAIRLARILASLMPDEPEVQGLLALMLLTDARRAARVSGGALVPLPDQDRTRWDPELITEGHAIVRACLRRNRPGPYQLLAAINAVHTDAASAAETDWTNRPALRPAVHRDPHPRRRAQPGHSRCRGRRACSGAGYRQPAGPGRLPPVPRRPGRPAPTRASQDRGRPGLHAGHRPRVQPR